MATVPSRLPLFLESSSQELPRPLAEIVDQFQAAAGDDDALKDACRALGRMLGATMIAAHRYDFDLPQGSVLVPIEGVDASGSEAYREHFSKVNVWMLQGRELVRPRSVPVSHLMCPDAVFANSEWHNDYLRRYGVFHSMGFVVSMSGTATETVTFLRARRLGNYEEHEQRRLQLLGPYLEGAFRLHERLCSARELGGLGLSLIDRMQDGVLLVGPRGTVKAINHAASELVGARDGLELLDDRLVATLPSAAKVLRRVIDAALGEGAGRTGSESSTLVPRPSGSLPYQVVVVPLRSAASWFCEPRAYAAVFVTDPECRSDVEARRLMEMYHLTRSEAKLAALLAAGVDLKGAAGQMEVSFNTVKTHLAHLFAKTFTNRQPELVRLVLLARHGPAGPASTNNTMARGAFARLRR